MRRAKGGSAKPEKVITIDVRKLVWALMLLFICVLIIIGIVRFIKGFMRVSVFEITGDSPYENEEIINASGIKRGERLYELDKEQIAADIKRKCPYVNNITVETKFPNKLKIDVDSFAASWYVEILGDYYALDGNLRVLEESASEQKFINAGIAKLTLPSIKSAIVGTTLIYGDDIELDFTEDFLEMLRTTLFASRLTLVDIDNRFDIYVQVDGNINVYMGNGDKARDKLNAVERALKDKKLENCVSAEIDVSDPAAVSVRPVLSYEN